jgi:dienelactone hydrolase
MVRANSQAWKIDPDRIGIIGFSAGGHLASTAATHFDDGSPAASDSVELVSCRPDFAILVYPVVTMGEKTHQGSRHNLLGKDPSPKLVEQFSNELQVTAQTPPMFLAHAMNDAPVPPENSKLLFDALQARKIPSEYLELPSGGHGLNGYKGPMWDAWQERSLAWLTELKFLPPAKPIELLNSDATRVHRPILIAHRGGVITPQSPECSLAAIRKAAEAGYHLVELDIRRTRDHFPVVFHDRRLSPATDATGNVEGFDLEQVIALRYRSVDEQISTLDLHLP